MSVCSQSLHSRNAVYLRQLQARLEAADEQRGEWSRERAEMLEAAERKDVLLARLQDTVQLTEERERAAQQQTQSAAEHRAATLESLPFARLHVLTPCML